MARTQGHGNPHWTRDETILALNLYFDLAGQIPSEDDGRVQELSALLRRYPYHAAAARKESFRNPAGVAFKLQNLRQVATGKGLANVSEMDRVVWGDLGNDPVHTKRLAKLIKTAIESIGMLSQDVEIESEFAEGRLITGLHSRRERDPKLRKKVLAARRLKGALSCDMCGSVSNSRAAGFEDAMFEVHHLVPLSSSGQRITKVDEVALLCANCHRLLHRAIAANKAWLTLGEAQDLVRDQD